MARGGEAFARLQPSPNDLAPHSRSRLRECNQEIAPILLLPAAKPAGQWMIFGFFLLSGRFVQYSHLEARVILEHGLERPLNSNLRSEVTSEVIWRPLWPQRPPK